MFYIIRKSLSFCRMHLGELIIIIIIIIILDWHVIFVNIIIIIVRIQIQSAWSLNRIKR
jgi:TRAP-type mannitol/chloroaromatic compound transport system permease large subunit